MEKATEEEQSMTKIKAADLMTRDVFTLNAGDTVETAAEAMSARKISAVMVLDGEGRPLGILTSTDVARSEEPQTPLARLMTEGAVAIDAGEEAQEAARLMTERHVHHVPVTEEGRLVGMLSSFDFLKLVTDDRFTVALT